MGLWSIVTDSLPGDPLPLFAFARDDRIAKAFGDRVDGVAGSTAYRKLPRALRTTIDFCRTTIEPRAVGFREKVEELAVRLDDPA